MGGGEVRFAIFSQDDAFRELLDCGVWIVLVDDLVFGSSCYDVGHGCFIVDKCRLEGLTWICAAGPCPSAEHFPPVSSVNNSHQGLALPRGAGAAGTLYSRRPAIDIRFSDVRFNLKQGITVSLSGREILAMSDSEASDAPSQDANYERALRDAVVTLFKKNRDEVTVKTARTAAEKTLGVQAGFFKGDATWNPKSKDIATEEVVCPRLFHIESCLWMPTDLH